MSQGHRECQFKLATIDLDGTLLNSKSEITPYSCEILREMDARGCKIILCTGRIYHAVKPYAEQLGLDNYAIVGNGAQICKALSGEIVEQHLLSPEIILEMAYVGKKYGGHPRIYGVDGRVYVEELNDEDIDYARWTDTEVIAVGDFEKFLTHDEVKIINVMPDEASIANVINEGVKKFGEKVYMTPGMMGFAECMNSGAGKGNAVKRLAEISGVPLDKIIVAGDHLNDLTMFELPGVFGITCGNAQESVRACAKMVGKSNDEDGIADLLKELGGL